MKAPTRQFLTATFLGLSLGAVLIFASHTVYQRNVEQARETTARKSQQAAYQIELLVSARLGVVPQLLQIPASSRGLTPMGGSPGSSRKPSARTASAAPYAMIRGHAKPMIRSPAAVPRRPARLMTFRTAPTGS